MACKKTIHNYTFLYENWVNMYSSVDKIVLSMASLVRFCNGNTKITQSWM